MIQKEIDEVKMRETEYLAHLKQFKSEKREQSEEFNKEDSYTSDSNGNASYTSPTPSPTQLKNISYQLNDSKSNSAKTKSTTLINSQSIHTSLTQTSQRRFSTNPNSKGIMHRFFSSRGKISGEKRSDCAATIVSKLELD